MRKIFKSLAAIALVAFAASCSNELLENSPSYNGEEAVVNFSVATPGLMTRAVADGSTVNTVECYVYDKDGKLIEGIGKSATMEGGKADISLRLMTGQTYSFAFWAYKAQGENATSPYTFNAADKTLSVSYVNAVSNDESRDAFYAYVAEKTITGSLKEPVTLSRPFAQLNFGVDKEDVEAATALGVTVAKSSLSLKGLGNELNLATGEVSGEVDATFSIANHLSNEVLKVNNVEYGYVSMNYVLVGKNDKTTTDAKLSLYDDKGDFINAISLPNVPLQGNYRTNIIGKLYTSQADFQIVVDPAFEGGYNVERISIPAGFSGIYNLPNTSDDVLLNIEGDCTDENGITIAYNTNAETSGIHPGNVTINAGSHKITKLDINLEKSHVDVVGGTFQTMSGATNTNTLALSNSTKITGTLEVAKGSVEIACEVATVEVKETVTAEAKIVLAPTAKITTSMTTTSSAPIVVKATPAKGSEGQEKQQATVASIVVKAPDASSEQGATEYKAPVIELQDGATLASNAISGDKASEVLTIKSETVTETSATGEQTQATIVVEKANALEYALANGRNVKLGANIAGNFKIAKDITIDLNGQTLSAESGNVITIETGATLTLKDETGKGNIQSASNAYSVDNTTGTLIVEGISLANVLSADGVRSYVADETALNAAIADTKVGTIILNKSINLQDAIKVSRKLTLELHGMTLAAATDMNSNQSVVVVKRGGDLTITDDSNGSGAITANGRAAVSGAIKVTEKADTGDATAKLTIENGNFIGYYYAIVGNGGRHNTEITIKGGSFWATNGEETSTIYHPQSGTLNISGGTFKSGNAAVELRAGIMNISGGEFTATTDPFTVQPNGNGTTTSGAAIGISQHTTNLPIDVTISGGTFNGVYAIWEKDVQDEIARDQIKLAVTGGVFNGAIYSQNNSGFIYGGSFSDPSASEYKDEWDGSIYEPATDANGNYLISKASELAWMAKQLNGDNGEHLSGKTFIQQKDINLGNYPWSAIGKDAYHDFRGLFDGNGYTIYNLNVTDNTPDEACAGLFGSIAYGKGVKNVTINSATVKSTHYAAAVVAHCQYADVTNCHVYNATIVTSPEYFESKSKYDNGDKAGSVVGYLNSGDLTECSAENVNITGYRDLGGIVGYAKIYSTNTCLVSGNAISNITINVDKTHNYKEYTTDAQYHAGSIVGENENSAASVENNTGTATINYLP